MNKITGRKLQISENREDRIPIVKLVILCGLQELSLRGHRDQGALDLEPPIENDGNLQALLRYRIYAGDKTFEKHVKLVGGTLHT